MEYTDLEKFVPELKQLDDLILFLQKKYKNPWHTYGELKRIYTHKAQRFANQNDLLGVFDLLNLAIDYPFTVVSALLGHNSDNEFANTQEAYDCFITEISKRLNI